MKECGLVVCTLIRRGHVGSAMESIKISRHAGTVTKIWQFRSFFRKSRVKTPDIYKERGKGRAKTKKNNLLRQFQDGTSSQIAQGFLPLLG
jgi:hypothetical protein